MIGRRKRLKKADAELDITSFMNLMIVLVPVLLMMMVFSRITVLELSLPGLEGISEASDIEKKQLEILVAPEGVAVFFPAGYLVKALPPVTQDDGSDVQDWEGLQSVLKQVKQTLLGKGVEKRDVVLLVDDNVPYQQVISLLDTTRSYEDVVAASVVDAELFPEVSFAEVPGDMASMEQFLAADSSPQASEQGGAQ